MKLILLRHFDKLKAMVLSQAGFNHVTSADCKTISLQIYRKTNQLISETTLKRVFGFAHSKFKPSLYTMNAMAAFCGYQSWEEFCQASDHLPYEGDATAVNWEKIDHNANRITSFTLQTLENRSGIPYHQTISRQAVNDHFDKFLASGKMATVLMAPAGYGKTIALCQWVESQILKAPSECNNDIFLFFTSHAITSVFFSGQSINEWLSLLLGYGSEKDFSMQPDTLQGYKGKFYLIIDGLDESMFGKGQFSLLLQQLIDVCSFYQHNKHFKLMLTMRSSTWISYRHEFDLFADNFFKGVKTEDQATNIPLFSLPEIKKLCSLINPPGESCFIPEIIKHFSYPLYFQFYYQHYKDNFSFEHADSVSIYELVSNFILNKVYLGDYADEKVTISTAIMENMEFGTGKFEIDKNKINDLLTKTRYRQAYRELLGIGFLREINESNDLRFHTIIKFGNPDFLSYSLAKRLLLKYNNIFNIKGVYDVHKHFSGTLKVEMLKWCIYYAYKNGHQDNLKCLSSIPLSAEEEQEIIIFLKDMEKREPVTKH